MMIVRNTGTTKMAVVLHHPIAGKTILAPEDKLPVQTHQEMQQAQEAVALGMGAVVIESVPDAEPEAPVAPVVSTPVFKDPGLQEKFGDAADADSAAEDIVAPSVAPAVEMAPAIEIADAQPVADAEDEPAAEPEAEEPVADAADADSVAEDIVAALDAETDGEPDAAPAPVEDDEPKRKPISKKKKKGK
jgi:hypothetical protein